MSTPKKPKEAAELRESEKNKIRSLITEGDAVKVVNALRIKHTGVVKTDYKCDVNIALKGKKPQSPLEFAIESGKLNVVKSLIAKKASVTYKADPKFDTATLSYPIIQSYKKMVTMGYDQLNVNIPMYVLLKEEFKKIGMSDTDFDNAISVQPTATTPSYASKKPASLKNLTEPTSKTSSASTTPASTPTSSASDKSTTGPATTPPNTPPKTPPKAFK